MKRRDEGTRRETLALEGSGGVTNGRIILAHRVFSIFHTFGPVQDMILFLFIYLLLKELFIFNMNNHSKKSLSLTITPQIF